MPYPARCIAAAAREANDIPIALRLEMIYQVTANNALCAHYQGNLLGGVFVDPCICLFLFHDLLTV
jgi:hypothetical protein